MIYNTDRYEYSDRCFVDDYRIDMTYFLQMASSIIYGRIRTTPRSHQSLIDVNSLYTYALQLTEQMIQIYRIVDDQYRNMNRWTFILSYLSFEISKSIRFHCRYTDEVCTLSNYSIRKLPVTPSLRLRYSINVLLLFVSFHAAIFCEILRSRLYISPVLPDFVAS